MEKQTTIVEVNGVKLEVDLRTAKRIDQLKIGSRVKCLAKQQYGGGMETYPGVVGFEPFPSAPTILVAYVDGGYSGGLRFKSFNQETKDFEIVADIDNNSLEVDKANILRMFDRDIDKKQAEVDELKRQRQFSSTSSAPTSPTSHRRCDVASKCLTKHQVADLIELGWPKDKESAA